MNRIQEYHKILTRWHGFKKTLPWANLTSGEKLCMRTAFIAGFRKAREEIGRCSTMGEMEDWILELK